MPLPGPIPKRHCLLCQYWGRPGAKRCAHHTYHGGIPVPCRALAHRCQGTGAVRGQELGLTPGSVGWQRVQARTEGLRPAGRISAALRVPLRHQDRYENCRERWGGGHRGAPAARRNGPEGLPTCLHQPRAHCRGSHDSPDAPGCGRSGGCPRPCPGVRKGADADGPGAGGARWARGCSAAPRRRPRSQRRGTAVTGRARLGAGPGAASPGRAGALPAAFGGFLFPCSRPIYNLGNE